MELRKKRCGDCHGNGRRVDHAPWRHFGAAWRSVKCESCKGEGYVKPKEVGR